MAERRSTRTKRRLDDDELARLADDVFSEKPEDEADEGAEDELAEPEDEAAEESEDELAEPEDEADEELEDEGDEGAEDELAEPEDEADEEDEVAEDEAEEDSDQVERETERRSRRSRNGLTAAEAGQAALRQIAELTGKDSEGVTGVERTEDGSWQVGVEVVEDRRIPSSTDILATYDTLIDEDGELVSYRRVRRYSRGRGDDGDA